MKIAKALGIIVLVVGLFGTWKDFQEAVYYYLGGRIGDGLISTAPDRDVVEAFEKAGGNGKQKLGMIHVAYDADAQAGLRRAHELWANTGLQGPLGQELATPSDFEGAVAMVDPEDMAESTPHGPDPEPYLELIASYENAGFTHVFVHQIGDNQDEFAAFAARELRYPPPIPEGCEGRNRGSATPDLPVYWWYYVIAGARAARQRLYWYSDGIAFGSAGQRYPRPAGSRRRAGGTRSGPRRRSARASRSPRRRP